MQGRCLAGLAFAFGAPAHLAHPQRCATDSTFLIHGLQPTLVSAGGRVADASVKSCKGGVRAVSTGTITTTDATTIFYKDWGTGQPIVFSHGWPLNADAWDDQMFFLASRGYRCIAHDRRGHGRSSQPWTGNDMDTYADDLAALVEARSEERRVGKEGRSEGCAEDLQSRA